MPPPIPLVTRSIQIFAALLGVDVIAGPIPSDLGKLVAVRDLRLHDNQLSGELRDH